MEVDENSFEGFDPNIQSPVVTITLSPVSHNVTTNQRKRPNEITLDNEAKRRKEKDPDFDTTNQAKICCECLKENPHKTPYMVKCDSCGLWAHYSCACVTGSQAAKLRNWFCSNCLPSTPMQPSLPRVLNAPEDLSISLAMLKNKTVLYQRIPKPVRPTLAALLSDLIDTATQSPSKESWWSLLTFAYKYLRIQSSETPGKEIPSAATVIRGHINCPNDIISLVDSLSLDDSATPAPQESEETEARTASSEVDSFADPKFARRVKSKLNDGDVRAALRLLTSDDKVMPPNAETINLLQSKHPQAPDDLPHLTDPDCPPLSVNEEAVLKAIKSMPPGSSGGIDGMRPLYFKDMITTETSGCGNKLLKSLTRLVNLILAGNVPEFCRTAVFGASLCAFRKEDGGVRPIAIGCFYRRLTAKIAANHATNQLSSELSPIQLGVGVDGGCEAAVHALRQYAASSESSNVNNVLLKLDVSNAFNSINRSAVLLQVKERCPQIYQLVKQSYSQPTPLHIGSSIISSETGVQQRDPLGPLCFALAIDPIIRTPQTPLNMWYLDDGSLAGPANQVTETVADLIPKLADVGLTINSLKCELATLSQSVDSSTLNDLQTTLSNLKTLTKANFTLLNSPIYPEAIPISINKAENIINNICNRIEGLDSHTALFFLTNFTAAPRLNYLLRSAPMYFDDSALERIDEKIRTTAVSVTNVDMVDDAWRQASLPIRHGGIGLRRVSSLAKPCYLSSLTRSKTLVQAILPANISFSTEPIEVTENKLLAEHPRLVVPEPDKRSSQKEWDNAVSASEFTELLNSAHQIDQARLLAAAAPHSASWIQAYPLAQLGLHLDDDSVRIALALRLGTPICQPHRCRCGKQVDNYGRHGLSCLKSAGRIPRHAAINDLIKRALATAGVPATLEPVGLESSNSNRPDGVTIFPFSHGKSMCWDATVVDTFAKSSVMDAAVTTGAAAKKAEKRKVTHYQGLGDRYQFYPIALETTGVYGPQTEDFIKQLGRRLRAYTDEVRQTQWLRQRISVAIARGNAAAITATGNFTED